MSETPKFVYFRGGRNIVELGGPNIRGKVKEKTKAMNGPISCGRVELELAPILMNSLV